MNVRVWVKSVLIMVVIVAVLIFFGKIYERTRNSVYFFLGEVGLDLSENESIKTSQIIFTNTDDRAVQISKEGDLKIMCFSRTVGCFFEIGTCPQYTTDVISIFVAGAKMEDVYGKSAVIHIVDRDTGRTQRYEINGTACKITQTRFWGDEYLRYYRVFHARPFQGEFLLWVNENVEFFKIWLRDMKSAFI